MGFELLIMLLTVVHPAQAEMQVVWHWILRVSSSYVLSVVLNVGSMLQLLNTERCFIIRLSSMPAYVNAWFAQCCFLFFWIFSWLFPDSATVMTNCPWPKFTSYALLVTRKKLSVALSLSAAYCLPSWHVVSQINVRLLLFSYRVIFKLQIAIVCQVV